MGWGIVSFRQNFLKRLYRLNHILFWSKFFKKRVCDELYSFSFKTFLEDSVVSTISSFDQSIVKRQYWLNPVVFGTRSSIRPIWIDLYSLFINLFHKDYTDWIALSCHQNFLKREDQLNPIVFCSNFLKIQYGLDRFVCWSKHSKTRAWIEPYCI